VERERVKRGEKRGKRNKNKGEKKKKGRVRWCLEKNVGMCVRLRQY